MAKEIPILNFIKSKDAALRSRGLELVYDSSFTMVESYILKNGGIESDAKDIFQEGIMILYQNIVNGKFEGRSSISTYMFSICKNLWLDKKRKKTLKVTSLTVEDEFLYEDFGQTHINIQTLDLVLSELKKDCQSILKGFYYQKKSMEELASEFNLSSVQAAKNKKLRCLKKLSIFIKKRGLEKKHFLD